MKLIEIQSAVQAYLLKTELNENCFLTQDLACLKERLDIYREGYYWRLQSVLKSDYAGLERYLGESDFDDLMIAYLKIHPSQSFSVRSVGMKLPEFIRTQYPDKVIWAELAQFECSLNTALYSEDLARLSMEALKLIALEQWPEWVFRLHPSVELLSFNYNAPEFWESLMSEDHELDIVKYAEPQAYLVWSKLRESYFCPISLDEKRMFECIQQQENFATLCERLCEFIPEERVVQWVSGVLQRWISDELFIAA